jgi:hypothetical protein
MEDRRLVGSRSRLDECAATAGARWQAVRGSQRHPGSETSPRTARTSTGAGDEDERHPRNGRRALRALLRQRRPPSRCLPRRSSSPSCSVRRRSRLPAASRAGTTLPCRRTRRRRGPRSMTGRRHWGGSRWTTVVRDRNAVDLAGQRSGPRAEPLREPYPEPTRGMLSRCPFRRLLRGWSRSLSRASSAGFDRAGRRSPRGPLRAVSLPIATSVLPTSW